MRFEGRSEFFGSIFFDFKTLKSYLFDKESTKIFKDLIYHPISQIKKKYPDKLSFFIRINNLGLIAKSNPNYSFIKTKTMNGVLSAPIRVHYAITSKCNLHCKHCFTRNILSRTERELTYEEKLKILNEMDKMGIREMLISGGEPFLTDRFSDFLKEGIKRKINMKVFSNGLIFNNELIEEIKNIPLSYIAISIDGASNETISKVRGGVKLNILKRNIKLLSIRCKFPIVMQITATKYNLGEINKFINIALETGIKRIKVRALKPGGAILQNNDLVISAQEYLNFCLNFARIFEKKKVTRKYGISLDSTLGNLRLIYNNKKDSLELENLPQPYNGFGCVGGRITLFIDSFGYCHPCAFIDNFLDKNKSENIKKKNIKSIWDNNKNMLKMRHLKGNQKCFSCNLYYLCRGGCRARSVFYNKSKDLNLGDGWCPKDLNLKIRK